MELVTTADDDEVGVVRMQNVPWRMWARPPDGSAPPGGRRGPVIEEGATVMDRVFGVGGGGRPDLRAPIQIPPRGLDRS